MLVREIWTALDERDGKWYGCGDSGFFTPFTENRGELFLAMQRENGRCIGYMYTERKNGNDQKIGWVFEKRRRYEDSNETYLSQTWVELHERKPDVVTTCHFMTL